MSSYFTKSDGPEVFIKHNAAALCGKRWEHFRIALTPDGVEARFHDYYRGWVLGWLKFIKPKQFQDADGDEVTDLLARLAGEGKKTRPRR
ncbi:MAG: hypothetical protein ACOYM3_22115 [Terrimicrobiaceae bacterium]